MAARRCSTCGINYPMSHTKCPVCEEDTWFSTSSDPDEWWEWRATMLLQRHQDGLSSWKEEPIYLLVPVEEIVPGRTWKILLQDVYQHDERKLLLDPGVVIEVPNTEWSEDDPDCPLTWLLEITDRVRPERDETYYLLRRLETPDAVPDLWVVEFSGN